MIFNHQSHLFWVLQGLVNVPMVHITQLLGIWIPTDISRSCSKQIPKSWDINPNPCSPHDYGNIHLHPAVTPPAVVPRHLPRADPSRAGPRDPPGSPEPEEPGGSMGIQRDIAKTSSTLCRYSTFSSAVFRHRDINDINIIISPFVFWILQIMSYKYRSR